MLLVHPRIADVAVIGIPSAKWGRVTLAVVVATDPDRDERTVLEHCHGKLAPLQTAPPRRVHRRHPAQPPRQRPKRVLRDQFPLDAPE
jgi:acyl-CoA synthetase (AMP-forming)/AMP-acid ligase II